MKLSNSKLNCAFLILSLLISSCTYEIETKSKHYTIEDKQSLIEYFNSGKKYPRFENSKLLIRDEISEEFSELLRFNKSSRTTKANKIFRIFAHLQIEKEDSIIYFLYGVSSSDSTLREMRVKSLREDSVINDFRLIEFKEELKVSYDYWIDNKCITVEARNNHDEIQHSIYLLNRGLVINKTWIPDTLFRRKDLVPDKGRRVRIFNDFRNKKLEINGQGISMTGRIINKYRGKSCLSKMIIELDKNPYIEFDYVQTILAINTSSSLYSLRSDTLLRIKDQCLKIAHWPKYEPKLITDSVYIEYY